MYHHKVLAQQETFPSFKQWTLDHTELLRMEWKHCSSFIEAFPFISKTDENEDMESLPKYVREFLGEEIDSACILNDSYGGNSLEVRILLLHCGQSHVTVVVVVVEREL